MTDVEQVNAFLWHKQHLTSDAAGSDIPSVVRDVVALHATSALTPYLSLHARMAGFRPQQLDAGLYLKHDLVKILCMRQTLHVVPLSEMATVSAATAARLRRNAYREIGRLLRWSGIGGAVEEEHALARLQTAITEVIAARGPSTAAELSEAIPELKQRFQYAPDKPYGGQVTLGSMLLPRLTLLGLLVRGKPRGSWRSSQCEYALLRDWLPSDLPAVPADQAQAQLVRQYLAAFGPASLDDVAWWAGWSKSETQHALRALGNQVLQVDVSSLGLGFWLLASDLPALASTPPLTSGAARLLPTLDGYIMGYRDRQRFLDREHYDQIFDPSGNAFNSVWVDGRVVGIWQEAEDGIDCFVWEESHTPEVLAEAKSLGAFLKQGDTGKTGQGVRATVRSYPSDLYVKTPFTLGKR